MLQIRGGIMTNFSSNHAEMETLRKSGAYPIVSLSIFETIAKLKIFDYSLEREEEVIKKYIEYLENVIEMKKTKREHYLKAIKTQEIMDTQLLEKEDSYLLALYLQTSRESAMDYLLKLQRYPAQAITRNEVIKAHQKLLEGTSSKKYAKKEYRTNDDTYVTKSGKFERLQIDYFALPCEDIEEGIMNLCIYYNSKIHDNYTLIKPCLIHGLTGALQMFDDGNTRMGRMLQNIKVYELTEDNLKYHLSSPTFYSSKSYFEYREQYRNKLGSIAVSPNDETWNNWINFNLNRMEDQIYYMNNKLREYKKM